MTDSGGKRFAATGSVGGPCPAKAWLTQEQRRDMATLNFIRFFVSVLHGAGQNINLPRGRPFDSGPTVLNPPDATARFRRVTGGLRMPVIVRSKTSSRE